VAAKQNQDRQNLQQKQDREHQQLARQKADPVRTQQLEQQHQTRQMQQNSHATDTADAAETTAGWRRRIARGRAPVIEGLYAANVTARRQKTSE
jgi:hypothetical protein